MKEQVVASRGSRRSAAQPKGFVQRPARRNGGPAARSFSPRALFGYLPAALKVVLAVLVLDHSDRWLPGRRVGRSLSGSHHRCDRHHAHLG